MRGPHVSRRPAQLGELPDDVRRQLNLRARGADIAPNPASAGSAVLLAPYPFTTVAGSRKVLDANPARRYLLVQNQSGANAITVSFSGTAGAFSLSIAAGLGFEWNVVIPANAIYVYCAAAGQPFLVLEG